VTDRDLQSEPPRPAVTTAADVAYQAIRQHILNGSLKAGQRIDQDAEARRLDVSRMPVREALRRLEAEGLVEITRHRGAYVRPMSIADLEELYVIRIALEPVAGRFGAERVSDDTLNRMRALVPHMEQLVTDVDAAGWLEADWNFHSYLYADAQLPRLLRTIQGLWEEVSRYRKLRLAYREELEISLREHNELIAACTAHDGARAEEIIRTALERSQRTLPELLRETGLAHDATAVGTDTTS
jgi:DNA-binding GntR family transcriptional regulator